MTSKEFAIHYLTELERTEHQLELAQKEIARLRRQRRQLAKHQSESQYRARLDSRDIMCMAKEIHAQLEHRQVLEVAVLRVTEERDHLREELTQGMECASEVINGLQGDLRSVRSEAYRLHLQRYRLARHIRALMYLVRPATSAPPSTDRACPIRTGAPIRPWYLRIFRTQVA